ncbi:hypothetical protein AB6A23_11070 [Paenibacillus tarimensis]
MNPYDFYITPEEYNQAANNGISRPLLEVRIRTLAWSKDRAINTPPHKKKPLKDWVEVAAKHGICYGTLRYRANQLGWDIERAATQPLQDRKAQAKAAYEASRKYPVEMVEKAKANGISYHTFCSRINDSGWSIERAATTPVMTLREIGLLTKDKRQRRFKLHSRSWNSSFVSR